MDKTVFHDRNNKIINVGIPWLLIIQALCTLVYTNNENLEIMIYYMHDKCVSSINNSIITSNVNSFLIDF